MSRTLLQSRVELWVQCCESLEQKLQNKVEKTHGEGGSFASLGMKRGFPIWERPLVCLMLQDARPGKRGIVRNACMFLKSIIYFTKGFDLKERVLFYI